MMRKKIALLLVVLVARILFPSLLSQTQTNILPTFSPPTSSWQWPKFNGLEKVRCPGGGVRMVCRAQPAPVTACFASSLLGSEQQLSRQRWDGGRAGLQQMQSPVRNPLPFCPSQHSQFLSPPLSPS